MIGQNYNSSYTNGSSYLNINYHYEGMHKIKAGRGYKTGRPIGVESGPCQSEECEGTVITLRINTSVKGFETSTEKVCDTCGRVYPLGFQIIGKPPVSVEMNKWPSHTEWKKAMMQSQSGPDIDESIDNNLEAQANWNGCRPNTNDSQSYGDNGIGSERKTHNVNIEYKQRLIDAQNRLNNTNASKSKDYTKSMWLKDEYKDYILSLKDSLNLNQGQINDINWIIGKNDINYFYGRDAIAEDILFCICLTIISKTVSNARISVIKRQHPAWKLKLNTLYPIVKQKVEAQFP